MSKSTKKIITRFPPSPTGLIQMGNVRTAIYNYLYAKQHGGDFVFRIEDTDKERSTAEYEKEIVDSLTWLGLKWDNKEVIRQSERGNVYSHYLQKLVADGFAYVSKEDTGGDATKRAEVIRFKNPNKKLTFTDLIRGEISFDTTELGDFVIARSMTEPVYHMAVVVDDFEGGVTHIIRGEDHISNTPRQILILEAIGAPRPIYAHLPLILDSDKAKLSKRKHGLKVSLKYYRDQGYLVGAVINYMAMLGWNPGTPKELFSLDELLKEFDISKVQKSGAVFNEAKLRWVNKEYLKRKPHVEIANEIKPFFEASEKFKTNGWKLDGELLLKLVPVILDRADVYADATAMADAGDFDYLFEAPQYDTTDLIWRDETGPERTREFFKHIIKVLTDASDEDLTDSEKVKAMLWNYATEQGRGAVLWPMRFALTGKMKSPDPFTLVTILGKKESLKRLKHASTALK